MYEWAYVHVHAWNCGGVEVKWCVIHLVSRAMLLTWCAARFFGGRFRRVRDVDVKHDFAFIVSIPFEFAGLLCVILQDFFV